MEMYFSKLRKVAEGEKVIQYEECDNPQQGIPSKSSTLNKKTFI